jgi:hypothetical protein
VANIQGTPSSGLPAKGGGATAWRDSHRDSAWSSPRSAPARATRVVAGIPFTDRVTISTPAPQTSGAAGSGAVVDLHPWAGAELSGVSGPPVAGSSSRERRVMKVSSAAASAGLSPVSPSWSAVARAKPTRERRCSWSRLPPTDALSAARPEATCPAMRRACWKGT